jgi:2-polyprenyl-3-methyl-5-hydroxy-6-metoxy-1,4-benzoquinol methylase
MRQTAEFFSGYALEFEQIYRRPNIADRIIRNSMFIRKEKAFAGCQPVAGKRIIDIGCGTGGLAV